MTVYVYLKFISSFTITEASLSSQSGIEIYAIEYFLNGIMYEMCLHNDFFDINELDYLLNSSSSCSCSYGCVTSPTNLCLPSHIGGVD